VIPELQNLTSPELLQSVPSAVPPQPCSAQKTGCQKPHAPQPPVIHTKTVALLDMPARLPHEHMALGGARRNQTLFLVKGAATHTS